MLMWCRKVSNFCHLAALFLEKCTKKSRERFHILEEACLYQRHITSSKTTATFGRQLLNLLVCLDRATTDRQRSTGSHDSQPLTPSTRASLTVATQIFTFRMKSYCVAELFIYCWSRDCFRTTYCFKGFLIEMGLKRSHTHSFGT